MMMEQQKTKINLPKESYDIVLAFSGSKPSTYTVKPLSQECEELINKIADAGAIIKLCPEVNPTSIFFNFHDSVGPINNVNHEIVGAKLSMKLHLLGNYTLRYAERLQNFLTAIEDVKNNQLPSNYDRTDVRWVQIIRTYEF
jgi:hypothetical protein